MNDCNGVFDNREYSYLVTCYGMILGFPDGNYNGDYIKEEEE